MTTVSVSELKANLSRYLREVRRGGEVQVLDRGTPVARMVPAVDADHEGLRELMVRKGIVRPGTGQVGEILSTPPIELAVGLLRALAEDRNDRL